MNRLLSAIVSSAFVLAAASCCCTSDTKAPGLRPLPQFREIESAQAPAPTIDYTK